MSRPRPAIKALFERGGRYLLLKQRTGTGHIWTLPGGKVEFGESPIQTLKREVDEEVGLDTDVGTPLGMYDFQFADTHIVVTVFSCRSDGGTVDIDSNPADEAIVEYEWAHADNLRRREMNDGLAALLDSL